MAAAGIEAAHEVVDAELPQRIRPRQRLAGVVRIEAGAERGHVAPGPAERKPDARAAGPRRRKAPADFERHRLLDRRPGFQGIGPRQRQRPDVGLVGGVRPVSLVLHLVGVALHPAGHGETGRGLVGQRAQVHHRLHRIDAHRKDRLFAPAVDMLDLDRLAGDQLTGVQHDEAGAVRHEVAHRPALGAETQAAVRSALDFGLVFESLPGVLGGRPVAHPKAAGAFLDLEVPDLRL